MCVHVTLHSLSFYGSTDLDLNHLTLQATEIDIPYEDFFFQTKLKMRVKRNSINY